VPASGFVEDGASRLLPILEALIRPQVEDEYADRLANASSFFQRWRVRRQISREITRRLNEQVSPYALF